MLRVRMRLDGWQDHRHEFMAEAWNLSEKLEIRQNSRKLVFAQIGLLSYMTAASTESLVGANRFSHRLQAILLFTSHLHSCPDGSNSKEASCPSKFCF
jgi:hypothetical protein